MNDREQTWQHPWLRFQRLIRSILEVRRDPVTRPVMKATLTDALREREPLPQERTIAGDWDGVLDDPPWRSRIHADWPAMNGGPHPRD